MEFNENGLYKMKVPSREEYNNSDPYWCKNWTFRPVKNSNGEWYMLDTYYNSWDSHKIKVTDENIDRFEFVFDFKEVKRISDNEENEYDEENIYCVATGSGGYSCGNLYWVEKDAKKSINKLISKQEKEIKSLENELEWAKSRLEKMKNGDYYLG